MTAARRLKTWGTRPAGDGSPAPVSTETFRTEAGDDQVSPGDVIGNRYLLTALLGEGGMGAIWLARDLKLDIDVALKFIHREIATEQTSERLLQEARAVARLDHPSIVRIFDFGETENGEPFMAMEVLRGELLSEVLDRKGRLAPPNAVCTLLPVASAVAAAHAKGVVHRDLKPENILLVTNEQSGSVVPKVLDFGIAKLKSKGYKAKRITENDAILGTPDYMPPEQASGVGEVDQRADVWSLCVVLYEAITGRRPFEGASPPLTLIAIATQAPTPTTELGVGDEALWKILERGLQKEPAERFQTMRELGAALARWAIDNGAETDVAGTSIAVHWLSDRTRRPLSEMPPALVETHDDAAPPKARSSPARQETPAAGAVAKPNVGRAPAEAPRSGGTWPPRAVVRDADPSALETLVQPVSLPPELSPGRRWRWVWWLLALGLVGGVAYATQHEPTVRSWIDSMTAGSAAPEPTIAEPPPTTPKPHATATAAPAGGPATATTTTAVPPRPLPGRPLPKKH